MNKHSRNNIILGSSSFDWSVVSMCEVGAKDPASGNSLETVFEATLEQQNIFLVSCHLHLGSIVNNIYIIMGAFYREIIQ